LKVGNDFRSSPNNGHAAITSACPFRAPIADIAERAEELKGH
jgi:hypothetical protein